MVCFTIKSSGGRWAILGWVRELEKLSEKLFFSSAIYHPCLSHFRLLSFPTITAHGFFVLPPSATCIITTLFLVSNVRPHHLIASCLFITFQDKNSSVAATRDNDDTSDSESFGVESTLYLFFVTVSLLT